MRQSLPVLGALLALAALGCGDGDDPGGSGAGGTATGGGQGGSATAPGAVLACPPGELLGDDGSCLAPGIGADECGVGFTHDGDAGCEPILPATACGAARMGVPGDAACREVSACPVVEAPTDDQTQHVDASFLGNGDGSAQAPWNTIAQAVTAAQPGAVIAIAPGTYPEAVTLSKPLRLWGACADEVSISGGVTITAEGSELHALSVTGGQAGVSVNGATDVTLDRLRIHDTGWIGVDLRDEQGATSVVIEDSLIENSRVVGVYAEGSEVTLRRTEIRDVAPQGGNFGYGMSGEHDTATGRRATLVVESSRLHGLTTAGITGRGVDVSVVDSVVSDVAAKPADQLFGYPVGVDRQPESGERSTLTMRGSLVELGRYCGVCAWDSDMSLERVVVRDISSNLADGDQGTGIRASDLAHEDPLRPTVSIDRALVERTQYMGMGFFGADVTVERVVVRDIRGRESDGTFGHLLSAQSTFGTEEGSHLVLRGARLQRGSEAGLTALGATIDAEAVLIEDIDARPDGLFGVPVALGKDVFRDIPSGGAVREIVIDGGHTAGLAVLGDHFEASDVIVRNIQPDLFDDKFGDGIIASSWVFLPTLFDTSLALERATVEGAPRAGIASFSSAMTVSGSLLDCNAIALDKEPVFDGEVSLDNGGGNQCGCGEEQEECKVLQEGLEPPTPPL